MTKVFGRASQLRQALQVAAFLEGRARRVNALASLPRRPCFSRELLYDEPSLSSSVPALGPFEFGFFEVRA